MAIANRFRDGELEYMPWGDSNLFRGDDELEYIPWGDSNLFGETMQRGDSLPDQLCIAAMPNSRADCRVAGVCCTFCGIARIKYFPFLRYPTRFSSLPVKRTIPVCFAIWYYICFYEITKTGRVGKQAKAIEQLFVL